MIRDLIKNLLLLLSSILMILAMINPVKSLISKGTFHEMNTPYVIVLCLIAIVCITVYKWVDDYL